MMLSENRKNKRYRSIAKAKINGADYGEILLKDLSITGCCLESTVYIDMNPNARYKIEIIPEATAGIGKFELIAESKWIHGDGYSTEFGFSILESPKGKLFQRYVDYLAWRAES
ncbi:MAG: PilZ domain-containing protein [Treponema sp.]|nr:PilZ domain-containing protein [Treponema sp.]